MTPIENYYQRILDSKCPSSIRKQIVELYNSTRNISWVSRVFKTTRKTVRKIIRRFECEGEDRLKDRSRRPHRIPRATSPQLEAKIVALRAFFRKTTGGEKITVRLGEEVAETTRDYGISEEFKNLPLWQVDVATGTTSFVYAEGFR